MARPKLLNGPIGSGWVEEIKTADGSRWVARWKAYVEDSTAPDGRKRVSCGPYELGPKVRHGDGLKTQKDAEKAWSQVCDWVMGRSTVVPNAAKAEKTFRWFANEDPDGFMQRRVERWSKNMKDWYGYLMKQHILPRFGDTKLREVKEQDLQAFLNKLADDDYSECVVQNCRLYLMAVMRETVECGILQVSPAARIVKPRNTRKPTRSWLTAEQFLRAVEGATNQRDKLMMKVLYLGGLRRGELFGLQWRDFDGQRTLNIERQVHANSTVGPVKTDGSSAPVAIDESLAAELREWRTWCPSGAPDAWIFASPRGAHIEPGFWRKKVLVPVGKSIGIPKLNYHMFRRGSATEMKRAGIEDKVIQGQLRHQKVSTTQNIYMQQVPEAQRDAAEKFAKVVEMRRKTG